MKNILVAAIFLFSQLGLTAEKANQIKTNTAKTTEAHAKKFELENLTFSQLLLTKEEIIHLSQQDQATYVFGMIALAQIIEGSQRYHMDYEDTVVTAQQQQDFNEMISGKYANLFAVLFPQAHAWFFLGMAARIAPVLARAAVWVAARAEGGALRATTAVATKAAQAAKAIPKETLVTMSESIAGKAKNLKTAEEAMLKAVKKNPGKARLPEVTEYNKARSAFAAEAKAFEKAGGTPAQLDKAANGSTLSKIFTLGNLKNMAVSSLAFYGADTLMVDATGSSILGGAAKLGGSAWTSVTNWLTGTDLSGPAINTPEQIQALKAGDSSKAIGKTCLFGGVPSTWIDQGAKGILCTRPAAGSNENCKKEDNKFQCPNFGFKLANGTIDASLCIDTIKMDNLTVRCTSTLSAILEAKAATLDAPEAATDLQKNFGEVLKGLEARDRMKNDKGETKSIFEYCMADNVEQEKECGAIKEVLALLKTTDVKKIYETRMQLAQVEPAAAPAAAAPAANAPQGADPAADAEAAAGKGKQ